MGTKFSSQSASGYNSSPPPDDGSQTAANKITWSGIKTKLSDVLKTFIEAINSQLVTALDTSNTSTSVNYTTVAGDHQKPIEVTGTTTISLGTAATMAVGYQAMVINKGTAIVTIALITATDTLDGVTNGTTTLGPGETITCVVNSSANGYLTLGKEKNLMLQNSQSAAYTTVLNDANKHILHPTADNNPRTFTIDSNANVAYPIGTTITFVNQINTVTIAITSDTLTQAGTGSTGSRTLAANGIATALKIAATSWVINGTGLS